MSQDYIEITEKTVEEAITTACQKLSVRSDGLDYVVVQREKAGFLGIGARPAIIKARVKKDTDANQAILDDVLSRADQKVKKGKASEKASGKASEEKAKSGKKTDKKVEKKAEKSAKKAAKEEVKEEKKAEKTEKAESKETKKSSKPQKSKKAADASVKSAAGEARQAAAEEGAAEKAAHPKKKNPAPKLTDEQIEEVKQIAHKFLEDVFKAMEMEVVIKEEYDKETGTLSIDMEGDDMGVLIGKRGQTLDSLQYLVSLVVNKGVEGYIHVKADTENYRERRKKTLENLAKNVAGKVKRTRQPAALEPMNPYERRIIHSSLQGEKYVTTYSEGEEPYRKVIVTLKTDENGEILLKEDQDSGRGRDRRRGNRRGGRGQDGRRDRRRSKEDRYAANDAEEVIDVQAEVNAAISAAAEPAAESGANPAAEE